MEKFSDREIRNISKQTRRDFVPKTGLQDRKNVDRTRSILSGSPSSRDDFNRQWRVELASVNRTDTWKLSPGDDSRCKSRANYQTTLIIVECGGDVCLEVTLFVVPDAKLACEGILGLDAATANERDTRGVEKWNDGGSFVNVERRMK